MFSDVERQIYRYVSDEKTIAYDPTVIWRRIQAELDGENWDRYLDAINRKPNEQIQAAPYLEAVARLAEIGRVAFSLSPLDEDGNGVTEIAAVRRLLDFLGWEGDLKKNGETPPSGSLPMDIPPT